MVSKKGGNDIPFLKYLPGFTYLTRRGKKSPLLVLIPNETSLPGPFFPLFPPHHTHTRTHTPNSLITYSLLSPVSGEGGGLVGGRSSILVEPLKKGLTSFDPSIILLKECQRGRRCLPHGRGDIFSISLSLSFSCSVKTY